MLGEQQREEKQKQSLELLSRSTYASDCNHYRHTIYSKYFTHYFNNIVLYPLHFSNCPPARLQ